MKKHEIETLEKARLIKKPRPRNFLGNYDNANLSQNDSAYETISNQSKAVSPG